MKILKTSKDLSRIDAYNMTHASTEKMKDAEGETLNVTAWILGSAEGEDGKPYSVLLITDGEITYSTSSDVFISMFMEAVETFGDDLKGIDVKMMKSKKTGREYLSLKKVYA